MLREIAEALCSGAGYFFRRAEWWRADFPHRRPLPKIYLHMVGANVRLLVYIFCEML